MKTFFLLLTLSVSVSAYASKTGVQTAIEATKQSADLQIKQLVTPLLEKYCRDECKLMSISTSVDLALPDEVAPGFDEIDPRSAANLAASSGTIKLLIDEKVGPITKSKLLELIQQYLDTLDFPVKIDTQVSRFPQQAGSAGKLSELREKISKQFKSTIEDLFRQFCPEQCLLADFDLKTQAINPEEAQYGSEGEFFEDDGVALRLKEITSTLLVDESLTPEEQANILTMAKLKTNFFKNVNLNAKSMKFPKPTGYRDANGTWINTGSMGGKSSSEKQNLKSDSQSHLQSKSTSENQENKNSNNTNSVSEKNDKTDRYELHEKIERVENGDAVQAELQKFKVYGVIFSAIVLALLSLIVLSSYKPALGQLQFWKKLEKAASQRDSHADGAPLAKGKSADSTGIGKGMPHHRHEAQHLLDELMSIFSTQPKVSKYVFTRVLTEEGIETTSAYLHLFGESVVMDMLRDPSLQADLNELIEYHARNPIDLEDEEKYELLRKLYNRTIAGKLIVMGSRSSNLFDFLVEMDGAQIMELIRNESITVKAIVLTQCDSQKRTAIYQHLDEGNKLELMNELSRIDYLPREYIFNVANALKRKRKDNPRLNTEALPGSEVLVTLLERTGAGTQRTVVKNLELNNPDSARVVKNRLVSIETLRFLRDGQLLEVVLSLKHDELLQFLKGAPSHLSAHILAKSPRDLGGELSEELASIPAPSRDAYLNVERKLVNRMKIMANDGVISLVEANDRMLMEVLPDSIAEDRTGTNTQLKKVSGW